MDQHPMITERVGGLLTIIETNRRGHRYKTVFVNYGPIVRFNLEDLAEQKLAAIQLVELGHCSQSDAGLICGLHRNTVAKILEIKQLLGIEAVLEEHRGLKGPYKYTPAVIQCIEQLLNDHTDWSDRDIAAQAAADLSQTISRSAVLRIRTKHNPPPPPESLTFEQIVELAKAADAIDRERWQTQQLELNLEAVPEFKQAVVEFSQEPGPIPERTTEHVLIERLSHGARNAFAGGLMHSLFLEEFDFKKFLEPYPLLAGSTYQSPVCRQAGGTFSELFFTASSKTSARLRP